MSQIETEVRSDSDLIAAVQNGDSESFRQLVERHSSTVFGITWSRLGDRSLAEDAAQETFIKAYKTLRFLKHSEKFGAWLAAIARHAAINLGIRHRREIDKRERWKLEQSCPADSASDHPAPLSDQAIRQTLASLPQVHRETLVLFYLEGKSIAEAAAALGITETAFKTRLHRARERMRSALESRLESSLGALRPSAKFAAGVMLALPAPSNASILGGGLAAAAFKALPFTWIILAVQAIAFIPGMFFARWLIRKDAENFRDPNGFRARNMAQMQRSALWIVPCFALVFLYFLITAREAGSSVVLHAVAILILPYLIWCARRLRLVQNRQTIGEFILTGVCFGMFTLLDFDSPSHYWIFANAITMAILSVTMARIPLRMDYSLFLRAAEGLLSPPENPSPSPRQFSRAELFSFARFLSERHLINDWRWRGAHIQLKLTPITQRLPGGLFPFVWKNNSWLDIAPSGETTAVVAPAAQRDLARLGRPSSLDALRPRVTGNAQAALHEFSASRLSDAESLLGEEPSDRVFRASPEKTLSARTRVWVFRIFASLRLISAFFGRQAYWSGRDFGLERLNLTEPQFRQALEATLLSTNRATLILEGPWTTILFPERRFFSPPALAAFHGLLRTKFTNYHSTAHVGAPSLALLHDGLLQRAFLSGLLTTNDFPAFNISIAEMRREIRSWNDTHRREYLSLKPVHIRNTSRTLLDTSSLHLRIGLLDGCGLLTEFDLSAIGPALSKYQLLAENVSYIHAEDPEFDSLHGLFLMIRSNPLRDTFETLSILHHIGAIDLIDRQACIQGLLRFHLGKGLFHGKSESWNISGNTHNAFSVIQSLRLLDALDRIDLEEWNFRTTRYHTSENSLTPWETIEAFALAQRIHHSSTHSPRPQ